MDKNTLMKSALCACAGIVIGLLGKDWLFAAFCCLLGGVIIVLEAAEKRKKERHKQEELRRLEERRTCEEEQKRWERLEQMSKKTRGEAFGKLEVEYARRVETERKMQASPSGSGKVRQEAAERSMGLVENLQLTFGDLRIDGQKTGMPQIQYDADNLAGYAEAFSGHIRSDQPPANPFPWMQRFR